MDFTFFVPGKPATQGSKRHVGKGIMVESNPALKPWRQDVKYQCLAARPADWVPTGAYFVSVICTFARPKSHLTSKGVLTLRAPQNAISKMLGDVDKIARGILDAMTCIAFEDDSQVTQLMISKRYCVNQDQPGALITIGLLP